MGHCSVLACQGSASPPPSSPSPTLLKWIISLLVCCWSSRPSSRSPGDSESSGECIELGPMTLRDYISTLEPYNPEVHGWRGDEPRGLRVIQQQRPQSHPVNGTVKCGFSQGGKPIGLLESADSHQNTCDLFRLLKATIALILYKCIFM